jgi:hypothetical protein
MDKARSPRANVGGIIIGLLGVLFVCLKLTNQIDWSWVWVTAPFWFGPISALLFIGAVELHDMRTGG